MYSREKSDYVQECVETNREQVEHCVGGSTVGGRVFIFIAGLSDISQMLS